MKNLSFFAVISLAACGGSSSSSDPSLPPIEPPAMNLFDPIFPNSVASNDIDFITVEDPSLFEKISFAGQERLEMPSVLRESLFLDETFVFDASFADGGTLPIWLDPAIGPQDELKALAQMIAFRVGQLPVIMRAPLDHIVVNAGDSAAAEEAGGGFFILYADNVQTRLNNNDLSETIFHEAAHVSLQSLALGTPEWEAAVAADPGIITEYAGTNASEDFAEHALFAYTYLNHPDRLPDKVREAIETYIPNRVNAFDNLIDTAPSP